MGKIIQLEMFIGKLSTPAPLTDSGFQSILMEGMELLDFADEDCARLFDVSRPTVTRWRNGSTVPHRAMRRLLSNVLKKETRKRLRLHKRRENHVVVKAIASGL